MDATWLFANSRIMEAIRSRTLRDPIQRIRPFAFTVDVLRKGAQSRPRVSRFQKEQLENGHSKHSVSDFRRVHNTIESK
jgi:hypothetical protein